MELGYSDHSALSHQLRRLFGMSASQVRGLLGWEWLLDRWLASNAGAALAAS
jgi:AraC-like DNA-binding protein